MGTDSTYPSSGHGESYTDFRRPVHCILGLPFDAVSRRQAVRRIVSATDSHPCFLSTPNLNFLIASQHDSAFRDSVIRSDLSVADGMPLVWLATVLGIPVRERVAGSDIFEALGIAAGPPIRVFFFGGPDGAAEEACRRVNADRESNVTCVGFLSPGFGGVEEMSDLETIACINRSGADFVIVALGAVKGQAWIVRNRQRLQAPVVSHLGAVVNFAAGRLRRAPVHLRRLGLEWLWRIKEEPGLWRRYGHDAVVLARLCATKVLPVVVWRCLGSFSNDPPARIEVVQEDEAWRLRIMGTWPDTALPILQRRLHDMTTVPLDIELDLAEAGRIESGFIGLLMLLYGHQSKLGRGYRIARASRSARLALKLHCADFLLQPIERRMA